MAKTKDLSQGPVLPALIGFAVPVFLGMLFQQVYNMVDSAIVGKYLGAAALAGVGSTGCLMFLILGTVNGICSGFAIPIAQAFGAKNEQNIKRFVAGSIELSVVLATALTVLTVIFCQKMLIAMNTTEDAFDYAYNYLIVIFAGIPFTFLYNMTSGVLRSLGDSRTPVIFLIIASFINIILDVTFIIGLNLGTAGAGYATIIAQAISGISCLIYMHKKFEIVKLNKSHFKPDSWVYFRLLGVGLPMGLQYGITAIGTIIIQTAVNGFGTITMAGVTAGGKLGNIVSCPLEAIGSSMATFAGQNIGAGKLERVGEGLKKATLLCFGISLVVLALVFFFGKPFCLLFLDATETEAIGYAYKWILTSVAFYVFLSVIFTFRFTIQGMGYSTLAMLAGVLETAGRLVVGMFLPAVIGFTSICIANPVAWIVADFFLVPAYFVCKKKAFKHYTEVKND